MREMVMEGFENKKRIDLRGEVCPYTFVKSKLMLEEMELGEILEVIVDYRLSSTNIPRSMTSEGHEVLGVSQTDSSEWRIVIRKGRE